MTNPINAHIVVLERLIYLPNDNEHTVAYAKQCHDLTGAGSQVSWVHWEGNFKACIAPTLEEAVKLLRSNVRDRVERARLRIGDFRFMIRHTLVVDGQFWHTPCGTYSTEFSL